MAEAVPVGAGPAPRINHIELDQPWKWLAAGWRDLMRAPSIGLSYGLFFAVLGWIITLALWQWGSLYLVLPATAGFLILGPILAVGLYDTSRRLDKGETPTLAQALGAFKENPSQIAFLGVVLLLFFFAWTRLAVMIFFLFFGLRPPSVEHLFSSVFFSAESLPFLIVGNGIGAVLAALAFSLSVVSIPLLLDRPYEHVVTAVATSFKAVLENPGPLLFWAVLIVLFIGGGLLTGFLGLIVTLPLIGHASWHAYRDIVSFEEST